MGRDSLTKEDSIRLIEIIDKQNDLITREDGYVVYWPTSNNGALDSWCLRELADEIDKRNDKRANG